MMIGYTYVEEAFCDFYGLVANLYIIIEKKDRAPIKNFARLIYANKQLTQKQGNFILALLKKYHLTSSELGVNYSDILANPEWEREFRVVDESRSVWVETDDNDAVWICLRFPYQFKTELDKIVVKKTWFYSDIFDKERSTRMLLAAETDVEAVDNFVKKHKFELDSTYIDLIKFVKKTVNDAEDIVPYFKKTNNGIELVNCSQRALDAFTRRSVGVQATDMLIAKSLGLTLRDSGSETIDNICRENADLFWIQSFEHFLAVTEKANGPVAFVKDRILDKQAWTETFLAAIDKLEIPRDSILLGFRGDNEFNEFIKEAGITGKVSNQKYFIFEHKPPKWLFTASKEFIIIGTDVMYICNNKLLQHWLYSHPCAVYVNDSAQPVTSYSIDPETNIAKL